VTRSPRRRRLRRPQLIALLIVGVLAFLVISALLARALSVDGAERSAISSLVQAEARGDVEAALRRVEHCSSDAGCRAQVAANVAALRREGTVAILQLEPSSGFSLGGTHGTARVAFRIGSSRPIVQCVGVRHAGNVLSGLRIQLLSASRPLPGDASCG
jgi:hypothetical protein